MVKIMGWLYVILSETHLSTPPPPTETQPQQGVPLWVRRGAGHQEPGVQGKGRHPSPRYTHLELFRYHLSTDYQLPKLQYRIAAIARVQAPIRHHRGTSSFTTQAENTANTGGVTLRSLTVGGRMSEWETSPSPTYVRSSYQVGKTWMLTPNH